jgi:predicted Zn-dependent protease
MGWVGELCGFGLMGALGCSLMLGAAGGQTVGNAGAAEAGVGVETGSDGVEALRRLIDTGHAEEALKQSAAMRARVGGSGGEAAALSRMDGMAYYALGQLRAADGAFAAALKERPDDVESAEMRGLTLVRLGRPADAIPLLEQVRGQPEGVGDRKADPNYVLALCYVDVRRYDDARHAYAAQFGMAPDGAPAYLLAARMLLRREYLPVAKEFAEKAIAIQPGLPLAHGLLGEIALAGNHLDEAIAEFEKERTADPLEPSVYDRLGDAYGRAGRYGEAQRSLQEAVLLEPNATGPYILLGKTLLKRGDALGAATYLEHAVKMDSANYMAHTLLGQAYRAMGRKEDASRELATAQRLQTASEPKLENLH